MFVDTPSSSVVAEAIDDLESLYVDGITENDDVGDTEPYDVCDADTVGGYWNVIEVSNEGK